LLREHWLFAAFVAGGLALRVVTQLAYRPALIFIDSIQYIHNSHHLTPWPVRPLGYPILLRFLSFFGGLDVVPLAQHLGGLAVAVVLYATLLRLGVARWAAALATVPLLFDAIQLNLEQQVLSDTPFEYYLTVACCVLVWRKRPNLWIAAGAGLLLAAASVTRPVALIAIVPFVLTMLFRRARWTAVVLMVVTFAVPVAMYEAWFHHDYGAYSMTGYDGHFLYARVAPFADCSNLSLPDYEVPLCPSGHRLTVDQYMWLPSSPVNTLHVPSNVRGGQVIWLARSDAAGNVADQVILHQPFTYAHTVLRDFVRGFAPTRGTDAGQVQASRWEFPVTRPWRQSALKLLAREGEHPAMNHSLATFLNDYENVGYTPGPLLGLALIAGLLAALGIGQAKRSGLRSVCFLFSVTTLFVLLGAVAVSQFSWRYQLPQLVLLPPVAALAWTAFTGHRAQAVSAAGESEAAVAEQATGDPTRTGSA
jgi:hypothetical protein